MSDTAADQSTIDRVRVIMRRDLKLGPGADLPESLALVGGEFDLDSLDMLMLVTSMEKEFGIKITEGSINRESFQTLGTLAAFIGAARNQG